MDTLVITLLVLIEDLDNSRFECSNIKQPEKSLFKAFIINSAEVNRFYTFVLFQFKKVATGSLGDLNLLVLVLGGPRIPPLTLSKRTMYS